MKKPLKIVLYPFFFILFAGLMGFLSILLNIKEVESEDALLLKLEIGPKETTSPSEYLILQGTDLAQYLEYLEYLKKACEQADRTEDLISLSAIAVEVWDEAVVACKDKKQSYLLVPYIIYFTGIQYIAQELLTEEKVEKCGQPL